MAVQWNLAQMDPWQSFEAGFRVRRNIEAVRQQMQDRENLKALQELMAEDERALSESPARMAAAQHQQQYMKLATQQREDPESVDPRAYKAALSLYLESGAQILREDAARYENYGDQFAQNPMAVEYIREKLGRNAAQLEDYGRRIEAAETSLGSLQERDMIGDQAEEERTDLSREKMLDRHSAERVAQIQAGGRGQRDPAEYAREARDYVDDSFDTDELKELAEGWGMRPSQLRRALQKRAYDQLIAGHSPDLNAFLAETDNLIKQKIEAERPPPEPERSPRERGQAARKSFREFFSAPRGYEGPGPQGMQSETARESMEWWAGWWEGEPLADAVKSVGGVER